MIARNETRLDEIGAALDHTYANPCDVIDSEALKETILRIMSERGPIETHRPDFLSDPFPVEQSTRLNHTGHVAVNLGALVFTAKA